MVDRGRRHFMRSSGAIATLASLGLAGRAGAQGAPLETVKIVTGFPPGGTSDTLCRRVAEGMKGSAFTKAAIVENKPGAGGQIAVSAMKGAATDGSILLQTPASMLMIYPHIYKSLPYNAFTDVTPVTLACSFDFGFCVGPAVPDSVKDIKGFLEWAKANPDKLSHCSAGNGTLSHVVMEDFKARAGIRILHVPYQGSPPAMNDLVAGNVQVAMDTVTVTKPLIDSGKLRLIAAGTLQRLPAFPDTPTIAEQGFPGLEAVAWLGVLFPAQTADDRVKRLSDAVVKVVNDPAMQERFKAVGTLPRTMPTAEFAAYLKSEDQRWSKVIASSGIRTD